jgi:hypothetical protein
MVQISDSLTWALIRNNNSKMVKKNGSSKRTGKVIFSSEKGNVASYHSFKFSGIANSETVDVTAAGEGKNSVITFTASVPSKADTPKASTQSFAMKKDIRMDLVDTITSKFSALKRGQQVNNALRKGVVSSVKRD